MRKTIVFGLPFSMGAAVDMSPTLRIFEVERILVLNEFAVGAPLQTLLGELTRAPQNP